MAKVAGYTYFDVVSGKTIRPEIKRRVEELDASEELTRIDGTEEVAREAPWMTWAGFIPLNQLADLAGFGVSCRRRGNRIRQ